MEQPIIDETTAAIQAGEERVRIAIKDYSTRYGLHCEFPCQNEAKKYLRSKGFMRVSRTHYIKKTARKIVDAWISTVTEQRAKKSRTYGLVNYMEHKGLWR